MLYSEHSSQRKKNLNQSYTRIEQEDAASGDENGRRHQLLIDFIIIAHEHEQLSNFQLKPCLFRIRRTKKFQAVSLFYLSIQTRQKYITREKTNLFLGLLFSFSTKFSGSRNTCHHLFLSKAARKVNYTKVLRNYNLCTNIQIWPIAFTIKQPHKSPCSQQTVLQ